MTESIAVVILNWNGRNHLQTFLPSVVQYSCEARIYVIDNASTDNSIQFLKKDYPEVEVIELDKNFGFCGGYNRGLQQVKEDYYILLNSDVELTPNWISPLIEAFSVDENIAVVQPKIKSFLSKEEFEYAGAAGGYLDYLGYPFCRGRLFDALEKDHDQYHKITYIHWASGACFAIKRTCFEEENGFDEAFFAHMEEIDLCWRLQNKGYKILYTPHSEVFHLGGGTLQKVNPFKTFLNFRNGLYLLYKNLPEKKLKSILLKRMILDGVAGMQFLMKFQFKNFRAILKAHQEFKLNKINLKRSNSGSITNAYSKFYNQSIVKSYFLKKRRKFSELDIVIETPAHS